MTYKLGSLFDGSGGFPLAGSLCGIEPTWASEVEPYPIAVTRSRFPKMKHLGDISKINGAEVEPVDIITFGSPCQDLSVAGKRAGLKHEANGDEETTRSGLFMEAVRIIKEMRKATNGKYPTYALWENVPGAFSSNKGEDFRIVLQELIQIVEPGAFMPPVPKNGWPYADHYWGDGWSIAYRVFDAQYWGVPQRRRRIHLVLDLRGERAREVLFEREGVRGYFAEGRTPWKAAPCDAENCSCADDCKRDGVAYTLKIRSGCEGGGKGALVQEDKSATLATNNDQYLFQPVNTGIIDNIGGQAEYGYESDVNGTLRAGATGAIFYAIENHPADSRVNIDDSGKVQTLTSRMGTGGGNVPMVMEPVVFDGANVTSPTNASNPKPGDPCHTLSTDSRNILVEPTLASGKDVAGCLMASGYEKLGAQEMFSGDYTVIEKQPVFCLQGNGIDRADTAGCNGKGWKEGTCYTLNTVDRPAVAYWDGSQTCGTLTANNAGGNQRMPDKDNFNCVIALDRASFNQGQNAKYDFEITDSGINSTLVARGPSAVCCTTGSFMQVTDEVSPTLMARDYKDPTCVAVNYIVRRLTPTECARLQGFADRWGDIDKKKDFTDEEYKFWLEVRNTHATVIGGKEAKEYTKAQMLTWYNKLHTDSAEYKMWGNGIALPPALYCLQGIRDTLDKQTDAPIETKSVATEKETKEAWGKLSKNHKELSRQQFKSIKGQIKAGDPVGALRGLAKILGRKKGN